MTKVPTAVRTVLNNPMLKGLISTISSLINVKSQGLVPWLQILYVYFAQFKLLLMSRAF